MSLTNGQIKQIIDGAPDGATHVATYIDDMYLRKDVPLGMELFSPILGKWEWCKDATILRNAKDLSDLAEILALRERVERLESQAIRIFNFGYGKGHNDTVEGQYVDIHRSDLDLYHEDEVQELLEDFKENTNERD